MGVPTTFAYDIMRLTADRQRTVIEHPQQDAVPGASEHHVSTSINRRTSWQS